MSKRILAGVLAIGMMGGVAMAAPEDSLNLTVTVSPGASLWIGRTNYPFGDMGTDVTSISQESTAVINDSGGLTEKYSIKASNARNDGLHASPQDWTLAASAAPDVYNLRTVFKADLPGDGDFTAVIDDLENAAKTCDGFGGANGYFATSDAQDGHDSIKSKEECLWFRINTPTSVTDTNEHTIYITVTAMEM